MKVHFKASALERNNKNIRQQIIDGNVIFKRLLAKEI